MTVAARSFVRRPMGGFTLVELLVVAGIIAVLVSILLPTLSRARQMARMVKCASNQRQIFHYVLMYCNDNQGVYPIPSIPVPDEHKVLDVAVWMDRSRTLYDYDNGSLMAYIPAGARQELFSCPADPLDQPSSIGDPSNGYTIYDRNFSYNFNVYLRGHNHSEWYDSDLASGIPPRHMGIRASEVRHPENKILLGEEMHPSGGVLFFGYYGYGDPLSDRHFGGSNQCFADGHVERMDSESTAFARLYPHTAGEMYWSTYIEMVPDPLYVNRGFPP